MSNISKILQGIDRDQVCDEGGWWETSSGVKFGAKVLKEAVEYEASLLAKIEAFEKNAKRYQWLCDKGHSYHGAMAGTGSMSICRGPYILLEPPSHNKFSNMILTKQAADVIIDKAIAIAGEAT